MTAVSPGRAARATFRQTLLDKRQLPVGVESREGDADEP